MDAPIVHPSPMKSKRNFIVRIFLYLCFIDNTIYALRTGFDPLYWFCAITTAVVFITGILEDFRHGRK